jgi:hypothetical protein
MQIGRISYPNITKFQNLVFKKKLKIIRYWANFESTFTRNSNIQTVHKLNYRFKIYEEAGSKEWFKSRPHAAGVVVINEKNMLSSR